MENSRWVTAAVVGCVLVYNAWQFYRVLSTEFAPEYSRCTPGPSDSVNDVAGDYYLPGVFQTKDGVTQGCPCLKCCPLGERFVSSNNLTCERNNRDKLDTDFLFAMFLIFSLANKSQIDSFYDNFTCDTKASLFGSQMKPLALVRNGVFIGSDIGLTDLDKCCAEFNGDHFDRFYCVENTYLDNWNNTPNKVYAVTNLVGIFLSTVCFTVTILVYSLNPDHRNLHGMLLLSYFISLTFYYIWYFTRFIRNQYFYEERSWFTSALIYFEDLISLAFICWLTVICFNMWRVLGGPLKPHSASHSESKHLNYRLYSCFGWGIPILTGILRYLGMGSYTLSYEYDELWNLKKTNKLLFQIPGTTMLEVNGVLFLSMLWHLKDHFSQTKALSVAESQTHGHTSKGGIILYLKLAFTTGLDWALMRLFLSGQVTSFPVVGYIAVTIFHYQGVILFLILTVDKAVWNSVKAFVTRKGQSE